MDGFHGLYDVASKEVVLFIVNLTELKPFLADIWHYESTFLLLDQGYGRHLELHPFDDIRVLDVQIVLQKLIGRVSKVIDL